MSASWPSSRLSATRCPGEAVQVSSSAEESPKCRGLTLSDVSVEELDVEQVGEVDFACELSGPSCLCYAFECPDDGISRRFLVVVVRDDSVELRENVNS